MTTTEKSGADPQFVRNAMAAFVQIGALLLILVWCFNILSPFINVVAWGLIIAVALHPVHVSLSGKLGGNEKLASILLVICGLAIIVIPAWVLTDSTITGVQTVAAQLEEGKVSITPPAESVAEWPLIGSKVFAVWSHAASNLEETLNEFQPQLVSLGRSVIGFTGGMLIGVLQFVFSVIIAGVFLLSAENGYRVSRNIASALIGSERGEYLTRLSILTIRSVTKGVLGVAILQTIFAAIGLVVMDVPAAGLWAGAILILAIAQLPVLLILGPIAVWVFSVADAVPATIFAVYAVVVSVGDAFLKPMLLGRGLDVPMLVILLGAIGGAIYAGIIGLFIGAVLLALGYEILVAWMASGEPETSDQTADAPQ